MSTVRASDLLDLSHSVQSTGILYPAGRTGGRAFVSGRVLAVCFTSIVNLGKIPMAAAGKVLASAASMMLIACAVVPLTSDIPGTEPDVMPDGPAAALFVSVNHGAYRDSRSLQGFSVMVDGKVRGWIPEMGSYMTLRVAPGEHRVTVLHPWKHVGIFWGIPLPESGNVSAEIPVVCLPSHDCGVTVAPVIDRERGLELAAEVVLHEDIPAHIRGLKSVEQKD